MTTGAIILMFVAGAVYALIAQAVGRCRARAKSDAEVAGRRELEVAMMREAIDRAGAENARLRLRLDRMRRPECEMTPQDAGPTEWARRRSPQDAS